MKLLTQTGLTELITKIKSSFVANDDVITVNTIDIDTAPTRYSNNLITSGGVYNVLGDVESLLEDLL